MSRRLPPRLAAALALLGALAAASLAIALAAAGGLRASLGAVLAEQGSWACVAVAGAAAGGAPSVTRRLGLGRGRLGARDILVAAVGFIALSQAAHELLLLLELREHGSLGAIDALAARATGPDRGLAVLAIGLAPGVAEELLFRGWIQRGLVARWGAAGGIVAAAAIFGAAHVDPVHGPAAAVLGLYLGCVAYVGGGIRACVLAHASNNVLAVLAAGERAALPEGGAGAAALLALVAAAALAHVVRAARRREPPESRPGEAAPGDPPEPPS